MIIKNFTPHEINIMSTTTEIRFPPNQPIPRVQVNYEFLGKINNIRIFHSKTGEPENVPNYEPGTILIVSKLVADHPSLHHRIDLVYPGELIRDDEGRVIASKGLCASSLPSLLALLR